MVSKKHDGLPTYGDEVIFRADVARKRKGQVTIERFGKAYTLFFSPSEDTPGSIYAYNLTKLLSKSEFKKITRHYADYTGGINERYWFEELHKLLNEIDPKGKNRRDWPSGRKASSKLCVERRNLV